MAGYACPLKAGPYEKLTMSEFNYEHGRLNLPFVGHCTFAKAPPCIDWDAIDADIAVLGVPNDMGTQYRPGARFGPRGIREASTLFSFGHGGAYDFEDDVTYMPAERVSMVDIGDADIVHTDMEKSHANTEFAVRKILDAGALTFGPGWRSLGTCPGRKRTKVAARFISFKLTHT